MSHLPLDARAILHYLNELGYRNISATQLKEFLKDLRKLIKYEERLGVNTQQNDYYESLFRRTTASYRAKIDKENNNRVSEQRKSQNFDKPSTSKSATVDKRKILGERNNGETSTSSYDVLDGASPTTTRPSKKQIEQKIEKTINDSKSVKKLIEATISQVLREKYSQELIDRVNGTSENSKDKTPIKSVVEEIVKEKLCDLPQFSPEQKQACESSTLRAIIEDIVQQVLQEKLLNLQQQQSKKSQDKNGTLKNLTQDLQEKLNVTKDSANNLPREPVAHYNANKSLDSQALVEKLLADKEDDNKPGGNNNKPLKKSTKPDKEHTSVGGIKRVQKFPKKKPEWQDPRPNDIVLDKPKRPARSHSPAPSSTARSGCSKGSSSVLIRRSVSQGRHHKPNSDPVALYQYYKNEWEHFRKQIPGETSHSSLRWHVRQRLLDPE